MSIEEIDLKKYWPFDIETYPNCFTFTICRGDGKFLKTFEISDRKNETAGLLNCLRYLRENKQYMVGFNNIGFDYPIVHAIILEAIKCKKKGIELTLVASDVYELAQRQIASFRGEGFGNTIRPSEEFIKQVDLFKIHHFDNKARSTSLKVLEFNMRSENIEDLPFDVGKELTHDEMDTLCVYNRHDVSETRAFFIHTLDAVQFRGLLGQKLNMDLTNFNDTKIGKEYFISKLEKAIPGSCYTKNKYSRKVRQTKRSKIHLKNCLFDYYDFKRPEFKAVLNWFKEQSISETKGVFTDIHEHLLGDVGEYAELVIKRQKFFKKPSDAAVDAFKKERPKGWVAEIPLKSGKEKFSYWKYWKVAENLNVVVDEFRFDFGTGGIHGSLNSTVVRSDDDYVILDADVSSMYPNIAIANRVYPEHLSEKFCDIYKEVYEQRKSYPKGSPENAVMKLALNGVYGDSNNQYSPFYDPQYTMTITINGQLSLCLLAEKLLQIEGLSLVQVNTDGVTVKLPRDGQEEYYSICKDWEKQVGLDLEFAEYQAMYLRDVNNYIAVYKDGPVKRKGAYEYENLGWHQNHSALIVPMAAEAAMLYGKDVNKFICGHENKWDFFLRVKVPRNSRLILVKDDEEIKQQNICRYYPSKNGGKLVKIMPPLKGKTEERRLSIDKDWNVKICNDVSKFKWDIDYGYYIQEAEKLIVM